MKIFWSWQSDILGEIGRYLVRDALKDAIEELKQAEEIEGATRENLHLDQGMEGVTGSPDLARTIFDKIEKAEVVVADVTIVGTTAASDRLVNSNVAIELGYALHACTDARVVLVFNKLRNIRGSPIRPASQGWCGGFQSGSRRTKERHSGAAEDPH